MVNQLLLTESRPTQVGWCNVDHIEKVDYMALTKIKVKPGALIKSSYYNSLGLKMYESIFNQV